MSDRICLLLDPSTTRTLKSLFDRAPSRQEFLREVYLTAIRGLIVEHNPMFAHRKALELVQLAAEDGDDGKL